MTIVIYKSVYGSTKTYAQWIAEDLGCEAVDAEDIKVSDLEKYDTIIYGGGLYAEKINGISLITKNFEKLKSKKLIVYTTGLTPPDCREYYDKMIIENTFTPDMLKHIKVYNFVGKMIMSELTLAHRTAIKALKKFMQSKKELSELETLLLQLCELDGDYTDRDSIKELVEYAKS